MKYKPIIAIDFDGTIVENEYPQIGILRKNAKKIITRLYNEGYKIIIWTCRYGKTLEDAENFMKKNNIPFHVFNENLTDPNVFNPKPKIYANVYIDDKNLFGLPKDWEDIYNELRRQYKMWYLGD